MAIISHEIYLTHKIMAIKSVKIEEGCIACGSCESICPEVFKVEEVSSVLPGADLQKYESQIEEAAAACPAGVIIVENA